MKFNKSVILPILAVLAMIVQGVFGVDISEELQNQIAEVVINVIGVSFLIYGVFKNHKKEKQEETQEEETQEEG